MRRLQLFGVSLATLALASFMAASRSFAAVEMYVVTIDASTTQPVATGFIAPSANGELIVIAEGAFRTLDDGTRSTRGWMGPAGETRLQAAGQPIMNGMPWGALVGGFGTSIPTYQAVGRMGASDLALADVGSEYHLALNLTDEALAAMEGSVTATVLYIPDGSADVAHVDVFATSPRLTPTGLIANEGDLLVVLPYGALRYGIGSGDFYTESWFDPAGRPHFNRTGQPQSDAAYGALLGTYGVEAASFNIGDGGSWTTQIADFGQELMLLPNLSATDQANLEGRFLVNVIRIPAPVSGADEASSNVDAVLSASPNPMFDASTIRFALSDAGPVSLRVSDVNGRWVRTLVSELHVDAGMQAVNFDGRDNAGRMLPSGTYFYQLSTHGGSRMGRIIIAG